jgi:hypothetical protein
MSTLADKMGLPKGLLDAVNGVLSEELSDKQKKIDMNKNGKIDGEDLSALRNKKKPQGADFAAQRRKERLASNGNMDEDQDLEEGGEQYKVKSIGYDPKRGDYFVHPTTGEKVYKSGVSKGDHVNPKTGEVKKKVAESETLDENDAAMKAHMNMGHRVKQNSDGTYTWFDDKNKIARKVDGKKQSSVKWTAKGKDESDPDDIDEQVKVGDKVSFDHPMRSIPGKTMKKMGKVHKIEGDTAHLKSSTNMGVISYKKKVSELTKEEVELQEEISSAQISRMKAEYSKIDRIDPSSDNYKKLISMLDKLGKPELQTLSDAGIKFVSGLAKNRVNRMGMKKEEVEIEEAMSGGSYASFHKETGKIGYIGNKTGMINHVKSNPDHIRGYTGPNKKVGDIFGGYPKKNGRMDEGAPSQRHPLEGHDYHKKSDAELIYIGKDAHKAAEAMKGHNTNAENKYRDQANDAATVRYFRQKNGMPDWYKKKYGHDVKKEEVQLEQNEPINKETKKLMKGQVTKTGVAKWLATGVDNMKKEEKIPEFKSGGKPLEKKFNKAFKDLGVDAKVKIKTVGNISTNEEVVSEASRVVKRIKDLAKKKMMKKEEETPSKANVEKGDQLTGKKEPIEVNPEMKS